MVTPEVFPRPAYLEYSVFKDVLYTESPSAIPRRPAATPAQAGTPSTDSDGESSPPPRGLQSLFNPSSSQSTFALPTKWSVTDRSTHLSISQDGRDLTYAGNGDKDGASARTDAPIPPACGVYYFEVEIRGKELKSHVSIGFAGPKVKFNRLPGWEAASWGYHGDDGNSFHAQREGKPYSQPYGSGDIVGCGVDLTTHRVFYTKNGHFLGNVFENVGKNIDLYPSVGLQHTGESIRVNLGHEAFKFDIDNHIQQQKTAAWNRIMTTPLYASVLGSGNPMAATSSSKATITEQDSKVILNKLVQSYLVHHGYSKTVRAFQKHEDIVLKSNSATIETKDYVMDEASPVKESFMDDNIEADIERRTRIVTAVANGDIDSAIADTERLHPTVLKAEACLMLFKLRCRKFVELILETAAMKREMKLAKVESPTALTSFPVLAPAAPSSGTDVDWFEEGMDMDVDEDAGEDAMSTRRPVVANEGGLGHPPEPGSIRAGKQRAEGGPVSAAQYGAALNAAIAYGQSLQHDYRGDSRPEVKQLFKQTFGIVAWEDPLQMGGDVAEFVGVAARKRLANELNQAILKSQGRPAQPALETLCQHTAACISRLGAFGEGTAAFADLQRELLDA